MTAVAMPSIRLQRMSHGQLKFSNVSTEDAPRVKHHLKTNYPLSQQRVAGISESHATAYQSPLAESQSVTVGRIP